MDTFAALGVLLDTPAGKGLAALYGIVVPLLVWLLKRWLFPKRDEGRSLRWVWTTDTLVGSGVANTPGLEVLVHGKRARRVTASNLVLWNHGLTAIRSGDIAPTDPIKITAHGDVPLLSAGISVVTRHACRISIERTADPRTLLLHFDFLAHGDGVIIRVLHEGSSSDPKFEVSGTLIDAEPIRKVLPAEAFRAASGDPFNWRSPMVRTFFVLTVVFMCGVPLASLLVWPNATPEFVIAPAMVLLFASVKVARRRWEGVLPYVPHAFERYIWGIETTAEAVKDVPLSFVSAERADPRATEAASPVRPDAL